MRSPSSAKPSAALKAAWVANNTPARRGPEPVHGGKQRGVANKNTDQAADGHDAPGMPVKTVPAAV